MQEVNKDLLKKSAAGMRLIAQVTLYNRGDFARLKTFISESLHPTLLDEQPASSRVAVLKAQYRLSGKLRVQQIIATDKHHVVVLMQQERRSDFLMTSLAVEEEYPHRIVRIKDAVVLA